MRVGVGVILLGILAARTASTIPRFHSDLALWEAAVAVTPSLPRPALNYATALRKAGRTDEALIWFIRAAETSDRSPRAAEIRAGVRSQLLWLTAFGADVCGRPLVQPHC